MKTFTTLLSLTVASALVVPVIHAEGIRLENFDYPFPIEVFEFESQQQPLEMVYMDVKPVGEMRGTIVLFHGKNFSGAYWGETAKALSKAGYRVVMPDQIGFGKSTKPKHYQFSFQQLATNSNFLLKKLGINQAFILGHSMGGMIATRYALMFPEATSALILENPIGLEDWLAKGVPYLTIDEVYKAELAKTPEKIRQYQLESYYDGQWRPEYDSWVEMLANFIESPDYSRMAWNQALTFDMIVTQPVCYEFGDIKIPALLIIGQRDRTAIGRTAAPPKVAEELGNYPKLGRETKAAIPNSALAELDGVGHLPHIEAYPQFIVLLKEFLEEQAGR
jgi:pimeloyl-ACP methyl ester carboxylesterase